MTEPLAFLNGDYVPLSAAQLSVFDMGIVHGAAVTENVRTFHLRPFRLDTHLERLFHSLRYVGFQPPQGREELAAIVDRLIAHNGRLIPAGHELGVILFVTAGTHVGYVGLTGGVPDAPTVCVHTFPLPFELWADRYQTGVPLVTPGVRQIPADCIDPRVKSRSRLHWFLADRQARRVDPQAIPLVLDHAGRLTETSAGNIFIVRGETLLTPPAQVSLGGVSQATAGELARRLGRNVIEAELTLFDALTADELLVTSTPYCILPATRVNGQSVGDGRPGPTFAALIAAWNDLVGLDIIVQSQTGAAQRRAPKE